jgi:DNA-binding beta-propeller fold protein YncE
MKRTLGVLVLVGVVALVAAANSAMTSAQNTAAKISAPAFVYDPSWPKPLPDDQVVGNVVGVAVDSKDNIWYAHRVASQQGADKTPPAMLIDQAGNVIKTITPAANGGGKCTWGNQIHGLYVDPKDNIWIGFGGGLPYNVKEKATYGNAQFLKFSPSGECILQVGEFGKGLEGSNSEKFLGQPTDVWVDPKTNEAYIADGYTNRRIIVVDANTGAYKRHWGAYGKKPDDAAGAAMPRFSRDAALTTRTQFDTPHCIIGTDDGLIYVCDRGNQRIQVFKHDGTFVKEALIKANLGGGAVGGTPWDVALSKDQKLIYLVDGGTHRVHTMVRDTLDVISTCGHRGRWAGEFESPHSIAIDSKGNLYVAETLDGRRIQRFLPKGKATSN